MADMDLWGGIQLPEWSIDNLYAAFVRVAERGAADDHFSRLLMHFVGEHLKHFKWQRAMSQYKLEPADVAMELLAGLIRKTPTLAARMQHPCPRVLITQLNTAICRDIITLIRKANRKSIVHVERMPETYIPKDPAAQPAKIGRLRRALLDKSPPEEDADRCELWRLLVSAVIAGNGITPFHKLPHDLQERITPDDHAVLAYNLNREVETFAASVC